MWRQLLTSHTRKPATNNTMRIILVLVLIFVPTRQDSPCLEGFFGENCKLKCSRNCRPFETYLCDKSTGKCSEGCKSRLYGPTCNLTCKCPGDCIQATGECIDDVTTTTASTQCHEAVTDCSCVVGYVVVAVIFIIMLCLIAVAAFLLLRRKRYPAAARQEEKQPRNDEAIPMNTMCAAEQERDGMGDEQKTLLKDSDSRSATEQTQELIPASEDIAKQEIENLKEELRQRDEEIERLNRKVKELKEKALETQELIPASEDIAKQEIENLKEELRQRDEEIERLNRKNKELKTQELIPASEDIAKQEIENLKKELRQRDEEIENLKKKVKDLKDKAVKGRDRMDADHKTLLKDMGLPPDAHYHLLADLDRSKLLQCVNVRFDDGQMNKAHVSIDNEGRLVNSGISDQHNESHTGFVHYVGTCSHIPIEKTGFPQYFEVVADIELKKPLGEGDVLLEIAFCKTDDRDVGQYTPRRENCYSFSIAYNSENNDLVATVASGNKVKNKSFPGFKNKGGSKTSFYFGILTQDVDEKITVFNLKEDSVIMTFDSVNFEDELWAMFGLTTSSVVKLSMELVVGIDIDLTDANKLMIDDNLHYQSVDSSINEEKGENTDVRQ